ncbi:hypothetical protein VP1G_10950 [Cytospora mali]|uniref:Uncharacterized protein n=1 Tax=Cytospora mali TaxID=578113 RepID=A0A194V2Q0_CYTMA|nr:hypothetical protein VP1G_10950 [Valsa mali var. pyri (nom. inval.)]
MTTTEVTTMCIVVRGTILGNIVLTHRFFDCSKFSSAIILGTQLFSSRREFKQHRCEHELSNNDYYESCHYHCHKSFDDADYRFNYHYIKNLYPQLIFKLSSAVVIGIKQRHPAPILLSDKQPGKCVDGIEQLSVLRSKHHTWVINPGYVKWSQQDDIVGSLYGPFTLQRLTSKLRVVRTAITSALWVTFTFDVWYVLISVVGAALIRDDTTCQLEFWIRATSYGLQLQHRSWIFRAGQHLLSSVTSTSASGSEALSSSTVPNTVSSTSCLVFYGFIGCFSSSVLCPEYDVWVVAGADFESFRRFGVCLGGLVQLIRVRKFERTEQFLKWAKQCIEWAKQLVTWTKQCLQCTKQRIERANASSSVTSGGLNSVTSSVSLSGSTAYIKPGKLICADVWTCLINFKFPDAVGRKLKHCRRLVRATFDRSTSFIIIRKWQWYWHWHWHWHWHCNSIIRNCNWHSTSADIILTDLHHNRHIWCAASKQLRTPGLSRLVYGLAATLKRTGLINSIITHLAPGW